jgi:hypothetical protein
MWTGQGLPALGLEMFGTVGERQLELLHGEGRHPDADRIEAERIATGGTAWRPRGRRRCWGGRWIRSTCRSLSRPFDLAFRPQYMITLL